MTSRRRTTEHAAERTTVTPQPAASNSETTHAGSSPHLFTLPFSMSILANCGISMGMYLYMPTIAGYALGQLGASQTLAGLLSGSFVIGGMVGRYLSGPLSTIFGPRHAMAGSAVFMLLMAVAYLMSDTSGLLLLTRCLHGLGFGLCGTLLGGIALTTVPAKRRSEATGWFTTGVTIATAVGPLLGVQISTHFGEMPVFWVGVVLAVLSVAATFVSLPAAPADKPLTLHALPERITHVRLADGFTPKAMPIAIVVMLCALGYSTVLTYITPFAQQEGLETAAGFYFLVYAAVILLSRPIGGVLQDKYGDDVVLIPIIVCVILGMAITAWSPNGAVLLLGALFLGLGYGTAISAGQAKAIRRAGGLQVSKAVGSFFIFVDFGTGLGAIILSPIAAASGYQAMFGAGAVLSCVALVLYLLIASRRAEERQDAAAAAR